MIDKIRLKKLVSENLKDTFRELEKVLGSESIQINEYIILKGQYNQIETDRRIGVIDSKIYYQQQNILRPSILGLIDELSDVNVENTEEHENFSSPLQKTGIPRLEIELIPTGKWKRPFGLSRKNKINENGAISIHNAIYLNEIGWKYKLVIRNNSSYPAFYPELEFKRGQFNTLIDNLNKNKVIKPFEEITLNARHSLELEATGKKAIEYMDSNYLPEELKDLIILLKYKDEGRETIVNKFQIIDGDGYNEIII